MRPAFCASHIVHAAVNKKRASAVGKLGVERRGGGPGQPRERAAGRALPVCVKDGPLQPAPAGYETVANLPRGPPRCEFLMLLRRASAVLLVATTSQPRTQSTIAVELPRFIFKNGNAGAPDYAIKAQLSLVARAVASRGKADLDAVRACATIFGVGAEFDALGMVSSNSTHDPSAQVVDTLLAGLGTSVASKLESARSKRLTTALAVGAAILLCEALQASVVLGFAWLLGAGAAPTPFSGALQVMRTSRDTTRPLRLAAEIWVGVRTRRALARIPPKRRAAAAGHVAFTAVGVLSLVVVLLRSADGLLFGPGARAVSLGTAAAGSAPLVHLLLGLRQLLEPVLRAAKVSHLVPAALLDGIAAAACACVRACVCDAAAASAATADMARGIKPLRALLDLSETDVWLADVVRGLLCRGR